MRIGNPRIRHLTRIVLCMLLFALATPLRSTRTARRLFLSAPPRCSAMPAQRGVSSRPQNVLGTTLECCCTSPRTGFYRTGFCETGPQDVGRHTVCARVTDEFLRFSRDRGNDLMTPAPQYGFPGLKAGDKWCLCVSRWKEALDNGVAPPVVLEATHANALETVTLDQLRAHAIPFQQT